MAIMIDELDINILEALGKIFIENMSNAADYLHPQKLFL